MSTLAKKEGKPYEPKAWETPACPVCGSTEHRPYEQFGDRLQYHYVLCRDCRLVYLSPRPRYDDDFVHEAYEFYAENTAVFGADEAGNVTSQFQRRPEAEALQILEFDVKKTALLDVGCATGAFLASAKGHFQQVYGLEVSKQMAEAVSKHLQVPVFTDKFEDLKTDLRFSTIFMSHVIEHIPDPHLWLRKAKSLLAPGGIVVICVPNMFSLSRRIKLFSKQLGFGKNRWEPWRTPDHLYEPTLPAFQKLFEMNGYRVLHLETYSRSEPVPRSLWGRFFHRFLKMGTNWRFIVKPA